MNTFTATGRLANDAYLSDASGISVSNFRLASEAGYGKHQKTLWIDCSLWGPKADALHQYLMKGKHVLISGELTTKEFKRKDGTLSTGFSLTVDRIEFIGSRKPHEDDNQDRPQRSGYRSQHRKPYDSVARPDKSSGEATISANEDRSSVGFFCSSGDEREPC
ncbi:MAG: single-stranded DNA-binding protein [Deltaproteobacteria bacterium]|nr:single-stranded DNA-binding protein [Deltaproteobacteria bacterium]